MTRCLDVKNQRRQQRRLSWPAVVEITIHIESSERPFNRVDRPILIAIEFLKMVVRQLRRVRILNSCAQLISARVVTLRAFQHAVVHQIGSRLYDGFRHSFPVDFRTSKAPWLRGLDLSLFQLSLRLYSPRSAFYRIRLQILWTHWLRLSRSCLSWLLNRFRLAIHRSKPGSFLVALDLQVLSLYRFLLGWRNGSNCRSRLLCFFGCRNRLSNHRRKYGHDAHHPKYDPFDETPAHTPPY